MGSEMLRVIHFFEMSKFMTDDILSDSWRHFNQFSIESDILFAWASSSFCFLVSDIECIKWAVVFSREFLDLSSENFFGILFESLCLSWTMSEVEIARYCFGVLVDNCFFALLIVKYSVDFAIEHYLVFFRSTCRLLFLYVRDMGLNPFFFLFQKLINLIARHMSRCWYDKFSITSDFESEIFDSFAGDGHGRMGNVKLWCMAL